MKRKYSVRTRFRNLPYILALILTSLISSVPALADEPAWSTPIAVNDSDGVGIDRNHPHLVASSSGELYVVWVDNRNSRSDIYFTYSPDRGNSWSTNVQVNDDSSGGLEPQVAVDAAGTVYVAWTDGTGVTLATSSDNGATWSAPTGIATNTNPNGLRLIADTRSGMEGHLNAMWLVNIGTSYTKVTARHIASTNGGITWLNSSLALQGLYNSEVVDVRGMDLAQAGSTLRAALHNLPVDSDIINASSINNGKRWTIAALPSPVGVGESEPSITVDPYNMSFYAYHSGYGTLTALNSRPSTEGWKSATINDNPSLSSIQGPATLAAYKNGRYYAAWTDRLDGSTINSLYFSESNDYGRTWSADIMVSETSHHGKQACLAADDSGNLYMVWYDQLNYKGYFDIMFSHRGPSTSTPTPPDPLVEDIPIEGGTVVSNDPLELVSWEIPSVYERLVVTYVYKPSLPASAGSLQVGALQDAGVWFQMTATNEQDTPVTNPGQSMTVTVSYLNDGSVPTDTLELYRWDGTEWVTDGVTQVSRTDYAVTSTVDRFGLYCLMGEGPDLSQVAYLPMVTK